MADRPPVPEQSPHLGAPEDDAFRRDRFDMGELAQVLSHYDLGVISRLRSYPRGSRRSPKVRISAQRGEFLLKRRAPGRDDPYKVAFAHGLQVHLAEHGYPVPGLIGTRGENNSMLQLGPHVYEMFRYVRGTHRDPSPHATDQAGRALGQLHRLLASHEPQFEPPTGSYHAAASANARFDQALCAVAQREPMVNRQALQSTIEFLRDIYRNAAEQADRLGYRDWRRSLVHGDWHPGNLLYEDGAVVAVLDFDSARRETHMADVANAVLQFTMEVTTPEDPRSWPDGLDRTRVRSMLRGYDEAASQPLSAAEREALPWLVIEALVMEAIVPIAATGSFARIPGSSFLQMVERKVRWIIERSNTLATG